MADIQVFRDAPIIANKVRPEGSIEGVSGLPLNLAYDVADYVLGTGTNGAIVPDPTPELLSLTLRSRRGNRKLRDHWVRTDWQTLPRFF